MRLDHARRCQSASQTEQASEGSLELPSSVNLAATTIRTVHCELSNRVRVERNTRSTSLSPFRLELVDRIVHQDGRRGIEALP